MRCITRPVAEKLAASQHSQGVFALCRIPEPSLTAESLSPQGRYLVLSSLQDPGNIGAVLRSALAFGCDGLILSDDCPDLYSPKVLRAAMGGVFRQPVLVSRDLPGLIRSMREKGIDTLAAALDRSAMTSDEARLDRDGVAVVIGNEGSGLSAEMIEACGKTVFIPISERSESLQCLGSCQHFPVGNAPPGITGRFLWELGGNSMEQAVYWLWFAGLFGRGTRLSHEMLEFYGSAKAVFEASEQELRQTALLTRERIARVLCHDTDAAQRQYDEALREGCRVLTPGDDEYPDCLRHIYAPPSALFLRGSLAGLEERPAIAVVGSRHSDEYGLTVASRLSEELAAAGVSIVSGLAMGIDQAAHRASCRSRGRHNRRFGLWYRTRLPQGHPSPPGADSGKGRCPHRISGGRAGPPGKLPHAQRASSRDCPGVCWWRGRTSQRFAHHCRACPQPGAGCVRRAGTHRRSPLPGHQQAAAPGRQTGDLCRGYSGGVCLGAQLGQECSQSGHTRSGAAALRKPSPSPAQTSGTAVRSPGRSGGLS